jgi:hypothetical protein
MLTRRADSRKRRRGDPVSEWLRRGAGSADRRRQERWVGASRLDLHAVRGQVDADLGALVRSPPCSGDGLHAVVAAPVLDFEGGDGLEGIERVEAGY